MRVVVNFDYTWDIDARNKLIESLPDDIVDFRYGNPLRHENFCSFILNLKQSWTMVTTLVGPGLRCLVVHADVLRLCCEEIVAVFKDNAVGAGLIPWLGQVVKLHQIGYNVRAEIPRAINPMWLHRYSHGGSLPQMDVVAFGEEEAHPRGFTRTTRSCDGEAALIWNDGKYYPCPWCVTGGLKNLVYAYGELGETFEKRGKEQCHLRYCPLE